MEKLPRITAKNTLASGKFISLAKLTWLDAKGKTHYWETAERPDGFAAVYIIARLVPSNRYILIRQFRPPANAYVFEFPAGILNPGESPEEGARRELREETGYAATAIRVFPDSFTSPGLTDESVYMARAEIDETSPENLHPQTDFDPGEMIETFMVNQDDLVAFYRREIADNARFDSKLAAFIFALAGN